MSTRTNRTAELVGKFFHTTKTCERGHQRAIWQGHIVASPADGLLLIETFEWLAGEPYGQEFITVTDFTEKNPILYESGDEMMFSYEHGRLRNGQECYGQCPLASDNESE